MSYSTLCQRIVLIYFPQYCVCYSSMNTSYFQIICKFASYRFKSQSRYSRQKGNIVSLFSGSKIVKHIFPASISSMIIIIFRILMNLYLFDKT